MKFKDGKALLLDTYVGEGDFLRVTFKDISSDFVIEGRVRALRLHSINVGGFEIRSYSVVDVSIIGSPPPGEPAEDGAKVKTSFIEYRRWDSDDHPFEPWMSDEGTRFTWDELIDGEDTVTIVDKD